MSRNSYFKNLSFSVIIVFLILAAVILIAAAYFSAEIFRIIFIFLAFLLMVIFLLFLTGFIIINKTLTGCEDNAGGSDFVGALFMPIALRLFMPFILFISNTFNYRKEEIRKVYIKANNKYVLSAGKKVLPGKLLVILPHCLQRSECGYRIREGLKECRQCARCTLGEIKDLINKFGVMVTLATGGTSARKAINDLKPGLVVAVACERDLSSGIMDVRGLPVYGIINDRPNGPCRDTFVDIEELKAVIKHFTKEMD
ncbi:MAG TPA: DUF116 domain-containing protein [Thermoclostridium sp.]